MRTDLRHTSDFMAALVLFDVDKTLVSDSKDISGYVEESIRNIYGRIVEADMGSMEGDSSQNIIQAVLRKYQVPEDEINGKLDRIMEDLYYTYYNVAGHDRLIVKDGARELLGELERRGALLGIATGEAERISRFKVEKAGLTGYFMLGAFGNSGKELADIIRAAVHTAVDANGEVTKTAVVASSPYMLRAAKSVGVLAVGVANSRYSAGELKQAGADSVLGSLKERRKIVGMLW